MSVLCCVVLLCCCVLVLVLCYWPQSATSMHTSGNINIHIYLVKLRHRVKSFNFHIHYDVLWKQHTANTFLSSLSTRHSCESFPLFCFSYCAAKNQKTLVETLAMQANSSEVLFLNLQIQSPVKGFILHRFYFKEKNEKKMKMKFSGHTWLIYKILHWFSPPHAIQLEMCLGSLHQI